MKKIVIAGGTGFIRKYLTHKFSDLGYAVLIISRTGGAVKWDDEAGIIEALENAELLINLA